MHDVEQVSSFKTAGLASAPAAPPSGLKKEEEEEEEESAMVVDSAPRTVVPTIAPTQSAQPPATVAQVTPQIAPAPSLATSTPTPAPPPTVCPQDLHSPTAAPSRSSTASPSKADVNGSVKPSVVSGFPHQFDPHYTLPPIKSLPVEFSRKGKPKTKKREKEGRREKDKDKDKDEWTSLGLNRWGFTIAANPVYKRVAKASKCLMTRDWSVRIIYALPASAELKLFRLR